MLECKTVTLRTRPLKHGMLSYYLDYYPGYRDQETMKSYLSLTIDSKRRHRMASAFSDMTALKLRSRSFLGLA